jgi:hypothetical protein
MGAKRLSRLQLHIMAWLQAYEQRRKGTIAADYQELAQALAHNKGNLSHSLANLEPQSVLENSR